MKVAGAILIAMFGVAAPLSLWADAVVSCNQQDQSLLRDTVMAAHHGHDSMHGTNLHHGDNNDGDSPPVDCECCVSCISACASSAGTISAIDSASLPTVPDNQSQRIPVARRLHSDPDSGAPFRPPAATPD